MSPTTATSAPAKTQPLPLRSGANRPERSVNIRGVPEHVWKRARQNALDSMLSLRHYVIRVLAESEPFASAEPELNGEQSAASNAD